MIHFSFKHLGSSTLTFNSGLLWNYFLNGLKKMPKIAQLFVFLKNVSIRYERLEKLSTLLGRLSIFRTREKLRGIYLASVSQTASSAGSPFRIE